MACNRVSTANGAERCRDSYAGWGLLLEKRKIFSATITGETKVVPPSPLFREKFTSTGQRTTLLSISSIRWELGVVSLICVWRKWVVLS